MAQARNKKHVHPRKSNHSANNNNPASVTDRQTRSSALTNKTKAMSFFLPRRKPICFYCGCRSANKRDDEVRQWKCEKCEAVNYLDENGEITDPPAAVTSCASQHAVQTARPLRTSSPSSSATEVNTFCATCLKNQHLLVETLASYLPPTDNPEYSKYEDAYPRYREALEERYPQVCVDCEPKVRSRIKAAGYMAKTEHLRIMLDQTRKRSLRPARHAWGLRKLVVLIGGLAWWASLGGYVLWLMARIAALPGACDDVGTWVSRAACLLHPYLDKLDDHLPADLLAKYSLLLGLSSIWWHNQMMRRSDGSESCLAGLRDFYRMQAVVLLTRTVAWWMLREDNDWLPGTAVLQGIQTFLLGFVIVTTAISLRLVRPKASPKVNFHGALRPLRPGPSMNRQPIPEPYYSPVASRPNHYEESIASSTTTESLSSAPATPRSFRPHQDPLTPPPDAVDEDAMDWTPTQAAFNIRQQTPVRAPAPIVPGPSFSTFKRLPPAPKSQAARLRNPPDQTPYFKSKETKQQILFKGTAGHPGSGPQDEDLVEDKRYMEVAPRKFFPPMDHQSETGLEGIFNTTFTLREEPAEIVRSEVETQRQTVGRGAWSSSSRLISIIVLTAALAAWKTPLQAPDATIYLQLGAVMTSGTLAAASLVSALTQPAPHGNNLVSITTSVTELVISLGAGAAVYCSTYETFRDQAVTAVILSMMMQELRMRLDPTTHTVRTPPLSTTPQQTIANSRDSAGVHPSGEITMVAAKMEASAPEVIHSSQRHRSTQSAAMSRPKTRSRAQRQTYVPPGSLSGLSLD